MVHLPRNRGVKILVLTNLFPPHHIGGYELICQTVVDLLRARGHEVHIVTSSHRAPGVPDSPELGVDRVLELNGFYGHPWRRIWPLRRVEQENNRTLRAGLERFRPDLVYVWNMGGLSKSMLFQLQDRGIPTVYYVSDHWIARGLSSDVWLSWWNDASPPWKRRALRVCLQIAGMRRRWSSLAPTRSPRQLAFRRIYFCSRALRELTAQAGWDVRHGAVIYCPVHSRYFQGQPPPPRPEARRLLYVGRLAEDKGVMTALNALALLGEQPQFQFTICGRGDAEYEARLSTFAREHDLNVRFTSAGLDDMPGVYRAHDILLFTSEWAEPFALTPIEAMASGLPVIGTATGGSAELFRHRANALVYPARNPAELANRIREFVSDCALRARCAAAGYREALEKYAAPVIVSQIERYLEETLQVWNEGPSAPDSVQCASITP